MSKYYDEDDLVDYSDDNYSDEYPEDEMDHEELMEYVADVKSLLGNRSIPEKSICESLQYYNYDVDKSANFLSSKYDKEQKVIREKLAAAKKAEEAAKIKKEQAAKAAVRPSVPSVVDSTQNLAKLSVSDSKSRNAPLPSLKPTLNLQKEIANSNLKPKINFVVIGHVDAGKSTLMGRLLFDAGVVDKRTVENYKRESEKAGKGSFHLAWVLDQTEEERRRGVTMDVCMSSFETSTTRFTILDAPGHRDFVPNMIAGSAQADIAVLVVDSSVGAFESGFHLDGQTKEHAILVRSLGVSNLIVAINKLDTSDNEGATGSKVRYHEIISQLSPFLEKIGFNTADVSFVPCSGLLGYNVVKKSTDSLSWYTGKTLLSLLESKQVVGKKSEVPFRLSVSDVFIPANTSLVHISGRIEAGAIQIGDTAVIMPKGLTVKIKSIMANEAACSWGKAGDIVEVALIGVDTAEAIHVSDILCPPDALVPVVQKFQARLVTFELARPILKGSKVILHRGRINTPATITKLIAIVSKADGSVTKAKPRLVTSSQTVTVEIKLDNGPIPMETFKDSKELGRVILRKEGATIAAGVIDSLVFPKQKQEVEQEN